MRTVLNFSACTLVSLGQGKCNYCLAYGARAGRNNSAVGIQTLDEACVGQKVTFCRPLFIPDRLQQEALNRASIEQFVISGLGSMPFTFTAHTLLLSRESCHLAEEAVRL